MNELSKAFESLPKIVKIILALPALDIVWQIYRLIRSIEEKNTLGIVLAVILLVAGPTILWIIDIICVIAMGNVWWFSAKA